MLSIVPSSGSRTHDPTTRPNALTFVAVVTLAAACGGTHPRTLAPTDQRRGPAARYLAIATVGNRGLERAFDALDGRDRGRLGAARLDLQAAAATERRFDRDLLAIVFPSAIEATARALVRVNEVRAGLASEATASASLPQLRRYEQQLAQANRAVEDQVRTLRTQLGLPPPETR